MLNNNSKRVRTYLIIFIASLLCGVIVQFVSINRTTSYYPDICLSIDGCCPEDEGKIVDNSKYCPRENVVSVGFPIKSVSEDTVRTYVLALNTVIIATSITAIYYLVAMIKVNVAKNQNPKT
jgi:hypothetical protein